MMRNRGRMWALTVGTTAALVGAAFGIGGAVASTGKSGSTTTTTKTVRVRPPAPGSKWSHRGAGRLGGAFKNLGIAGPPVHASLTVPASGGGFETATVDRGTVASVSGSTLTITEGIKGQTRTATVTVPSGATVTRNFSTAQLSDLKQGDFVTVIQTPKGAVVIAADASAKRHRREFGGRFPGHDPRGSKHRTFHGSFFGA